MKRGKSTGVLPLALIGALLVLWAAASGAAQGGGAAERAPSNEEIRALVARTISSQHRDDAALTEYERTERRLVRKTAHDTAPTEDRTFRVVPTGTGVVRVQVEENGRPVDAELYRRQLRDVEQALVSALRPNELRQKRAVEKGAKRSREHTEMVDAVAQAFRFTWLGRETRNGRRLAKLGLESNPAFRPTSSNTKLFSNVRATIWLDEAAAQLVRVEAEVIRDISFGGGVFGKVYRGGRFVMEQAEVAPGVWLPTRYEYNFAGRRFVFGLEVHEVTEASRYRRVGPPADALVAIRHELGSGGSSDP
jgi:hypothetical protein